MNSIPNPKQTNPHDVAVAALKEAYEQFGRADEQLARVDEQVSKLEQDAVPHPSDPQTPINTFQPFVPGDRPLLGGQAVRAFIGLILAACIGVAAMAWQSPSYRDAARQIIASWTPQLVPILSLIENPGLPAHLSPATFQAGTANTAPPEPAPLAQTAPEGVAAPAAAAALSPELTQLLQSTARDLATVGQEIGQLKTSQEQMVRANADLAEQLRAAQAQMARGNAELDEKLKAAQAQMARGNAELAEQLKAAQAQMARPIGASKQNLRPKTSAPPARPTATPTRKLVPKP
jgi:hypothetical protein